MSRLVVAALFLSTTIAPLLARGPQTAATVSVKLDKAGLATEATNDQRLLLAPAPGREFLWITATIAGAAATIDLSKVTVTDGTATLPLVGVDSNWGGDPKRFSMIAVAHLKTGKAIDPLEETQSDGSIGFAFTPGKTATVKIIKPPQSFCLLFDVPQNFHATLVNGLAAKPLPVPAPGAPAF